MRILHTSDWHIGRTFHGHSTHEALGEVLDALIDHVREQNIDVVLVAGDVFDSATPAADYFEVFTTAVRGILAAGAQVVVTSGNHDSATRLGFQSEFASLAGVHVLTRPEQVDQPVTLVDADGPVHFYGIPFLEPALIRHRFPGVELRTHEQAITHAMSLIADDRAQRGGRSVVLAHCFAAGVQASNVERDITAGGLDLVPVSVFEGHDYVALGHIHGRATLRERVRYSGAPLHYSFSEAGKPRGVWLVDLGPSGRAAVEWLNLPISRALVQLTGTIDQLLTDARFDQHESSWVSAVLTDQARPIDGMRRLQRRFPWCVNLEHQPTILTVDDATSYSERLRGKGDHEVFSGFLEHVRNGVGPTADEARVIADVIATLAATEAAR
ncbi:exonuclease SbcCD subunit D [Homoserinimonas sp. OAct 916]|uniref:exonuclease SbcCD subunit D n=1 Tax=Homoserinimonas sp. OAct 916 TaxID=2211450 RepID=UPI000DBE8F1D|nr:exonuclease SbcCD subunit D [Homoserinimonas sp. OAct 916]